MKANIFVEHNQTHTLTNDFEKVAKEGWKEKGFLVKDLKSLDIYFKPEDQRIYCVYNDGELNESFQV